MPFAFPQLRQLFDRNTPAFSSRVSVVVCIGLAIIGVVLGRIEESLAVQTSGLISAVDVLNSLLFVTAVKQSLRSPDVIHNYGYGKFESLAILASALLLSFVFFYTLYEAILYFGRSTVVDNYPLLLLYSGGAFLLMRRMVALNKRYADKFHLPMLSYDADLWRVDSYIELGILCNLVLGFGLKQIGLEHLGRILDSATAVGLLAVAMKVPLTHAKVALDQLLDRTLPEEIQLNIISVIVENISRICEFRNVHTRRSGKDMFIELDVVLPFDYTLETAFAVENDIKGTITDRYPNAIVRLYVVPCNHECIQDGQRFCPVEIMKVKKEPPQPLFPEAPEE